MSEKMSISVGFETAQAMQNVQQFMRDLDDLEGKVARGDAAILKLEGDVADLGTKSAGAARELQGIGAAADRAATPLTSAGGAAKAAGAGLGEMKTQADALGKNLPTTTGTITAFATSTTAMIQVWASGVQVLKTMNDQIREQLALRDRMIDAKAGVDQQAQALLSNLGLPNTSQGQQQAMQLIRQMKTAAPGASIETIGAAAGQVQSIFGDTMDVTKQGGPGQKMAGLISRYAAANQLSADETAGIPLILKNFGATDATSAQRILTGIREAQAKTGIPDSPGFTKQFLRIAAQTAPQGMSIDEVAGVVSAAALGADDPRVAGTRAEQMIRAAAGKDAFSEAALGRRALQQGALSQSSVNAIAARTPDTEAQIAAQQSLERDQRELADAEEKARVSADRAKEDIQQKRQKIKFAKTAPAREQAEIELRRAEEDAGTSSREQQQTIDDRRQRLVNERRKLARSRDDAALSQAFRGMRLGDRVGVVRRATAGMNDAERTEFFSQEMHVAPEEMGALSLLTSAGGSAAFDTASNAVKAVGPRDVEMLEQSMRGYETSPLGQRQAVNDQIRLQEATSVTPDEEEARRFREESTSRTDIILKKWDDLTPEEQDQTGLRGVTNDVARNLVYSRSLQLRIARFMQSLSREELEAHPELQRFITDASDLSIRTAPAERANASLDSISRKFVRTVQQIQAERRTGRFKTRTRQAQPGQFKTRDTGVQGIRAVERLTGSPISAPVGERADLGDDTNNRVSYTGNPGADADVPPNSPAGDIPLPAGARLTGELSPGSASAHAGPTYNVHVGNLFTQPGGFFDAPGRLRDI